MTNYIEQQIIEHIIIIFVDFKNMFVCEKVILDFICFSDIMKLSLDETQHNKTRFNTNKLKTNEKKWQNI